MHKVEGVTINVRHAGDHISERGTSADGVHTWTTKEMSYALDHMHIMLNGQDYGEVKPGDEVHIEQGAVMVNGDLRKPVAIRAEEEGQ